MINIRAPLWLTHYDKANDLLCLRGIYLKITDHKYFDLPFLFGGYKDTALFCSARCSSRKGFNTQSTGPAQVTTTIARRCLGIKSRRPRGVEDSLLQWSSTLSAPHLGITKSSDRPSGFQVKSHLSDCSTQFSGPGFWKCLSKHDVRWVHVCVHLLHL
eukprot:5767041-Amphidinium_carterae.3